MNRSRYSGLIIALIGLVLIIVGFIVGTKDMRENSQNSSNLEEINATPLNEAEPDESQVVAAPSSIPIHSRTTER